VALRTHRRAAGLTQAELAERAGIGVRTLRELERGRVARPQRGTVTLLADALGLAGGPLETFVDAARSGTDLPEPAGPPVAAPRSDDSPRVAAGSGVPGEVRVPRQRSAAILHDLTGWSASPAGPASPLAAVPPRPDVVGRDFELDQLGELIGTAGVITLTGLAGVGKTCLALAVVHDCAARFPGGVSGMAISDDTPRDDVLAAVAAVFEVARAVDLIGRYAGRSALVLLDSADRSPRGAAEAVRWLRSRVPNLTILVTSRHPLGVPGEVHRRVEPLDVPPAPDEAELDVAALRSYPAVALFLSRLRQVRPEPVLDSDGPVLAELVRRLGGLPLALELAAARGRVLGLPDLLGRYRYRVLDLGAVAPEGETLREALAASYRLLEPDQQAALRRLSVFRGRWSLDLAEDLLGDPADAAGSPVAALPGPHRDVEAVLDRLVALGLLNVRPATELRFRLLDMVRDFAAEECARHGETAVARSSHARVLARLAGRTAPELVGPAMSRAVARLDYLAADVRGALGFAAVHDPQTALRLSAAIVRWSRFRARDRELRGVLRRLLDDPRTARAESVLRAWGGLGAAMLAIEHGEGVTELAGAEEALAVFRRVRNGHGELTARLTLCRLARIIGSLADARRHGAAALSIAERTGRDRDTAVAEHCMAAVDIHAGDLHAAAARLQRAARYAADAGESRAGAMIGAATAEVARLDQAYEAAVAQGRAALRVLATHGDPGQRIRTLGTIGRALAESGRLDEARAVITELAGYRSAAACQRTVVEAYLALAGGDAPRAAARFLAAADALVGRQDVRDVGEALVGAAAATGDDVRRAELIAQISAVREHSGLVLLPRDRRMLGQAAVSHRELSP